MNQDDCILCLEIYSNNNKKIVLMCGSNIDHHICNNCFRKIKSINNLCPLCRSEITNEPEKTFVEKIIYCLDIFISFLLYLCITFVAVFFCYMILGNKLKINL
jgi:hypothetical protein